MHLKVTSSHGAVDDRLGLGLGSRRLLLADNGLVVPIHLVVS